MAKPYFPDLYFRLLLWRFYTEDVRKIHTSNSETLAMPLACSGCSHIPLHSSEQLPPSQPSNCRLSSKVVPTIVLSPYNRSVPVPLPQRCSAIVPRFQFPSPPANRVLAARQQHGPPLRVPSPPPHTTVHVSIWQISISPLKFPQGFQGAEIRAAARPGRATPRGISSAPSL